MPSTLMGGFILEHPSNDTPHNSTHRWRRPGHDYLGIVSKWREKRYFAEITKQTHQSDLPRPCPFILSGSTDTSSCSPARRGLYPITYIFCSILCSHSKKTNSFDGLLKPSRQDDQRRTRKPVLQTLYALHGFFPESTQRRVWQSEEL